MTEFDELRNCIEREIEKKYPGDVNTPGYKGPHYGEWTPGAPGHDSAAGPLPPLRIPLVHNDGTVRTQLVLKTNDNEQGTYWVDAPLAMSETGKVCSVLPGDIIELFEAPHRMGVTQVCLTLPEKDICVPHKTGTLLTFIEIEDRRKGHGE